MQEMQEHLGIEADPDSVLPLAQARGFDRCPVCLHLVVKNAVLTECAHRFCSPCLNQVADESFAFTCPTCRHLCLSIKNMRCRTVYRDVKQFSCAGAGCTATDLTLSEFEHHIWRECPARSICCPVCDVLILAGTIGQHECSSADRAVKQPVSAVCCPACASEMPRSELPSHHAECPDRMVACEKCGQTVRFSSATEHEHQCRVQRCQYCHALFRSDKFRQHECRSRELTCPVPSCRFRGKLEELKGHLDTHPLLADTGVYYRTDCSLLVVLSEAGEYQIARKISEHDDSIVLSVFGHGTKWTATVSKRSGVVFSLHKLKLGAGTLLGSKVLRELFEDETPGSVRSVLECGDVSHDEAEILCEMERKWRLRVNALACDANPPMV